MEEEDATNDCVTAAVVETSRVRGSWAITGGSCLHVAWARAGAECCGGGTRTRHGTTQSV